MDWKKYFILLIPTLVIGLLLLFYLPVSQRFYALIVPMVFWVIYHIWCLVDRSRTRRKV